MAKVSNAPAENAAAPNRQAPQSEEAREDAARRPRSQRLLIVVCLVLGGLVIGLFSVLAVSWWKGAARNAQAELSSADRDPVEMDGAGPPVPATWETAESLLRSGKFSDARAVFLAVGKQRGVASGQLAFRIALCDEAAGDTDSALAGYRIVAEAASENAADRLLESAAKLAQARVWMQRRQHQFAVPLLAQLSLRPDNTGSSTAAEALHLLAFVHAEQAANSADSAAVKDRGIAWPSLAWSPQDLLDLLPPANELTTPDEPPSDPTPTAIEVNSRLGNSPTQTLVEAYHRQAEIYDQGMAIARQLRANGVTGLEMQVHLTELRDVMDAARRVDEETRDTRQRWQRAAQEPGPALAEALRQVQTRLEPLIESMRAAEQQAGESGARMMPQLGIQARGRQMQAAYIAARSDGAATS